MRSVPPTADKIEQKRADMLNALFKHCCQQRPDLFCLLYTCLTMNDTGKDGVHLTGWHTLLVLVCSIFSLPGTHNIGDNVPDENVTKSDELYL